MKHTVVSFFLFFCLQTLVGQNLDSGDIKLLSFIQAISNFSNHIPQEKVYIHFDNTSYYQGDPIYFKCYVVTSSQLQLSQLGKTLYIELLNPGGEIVDKRILKIENGQCHGDFTLNQLPFYSGFYEVRAYTKYMLNFGDDVIYSRLLPVFNKPKTEGNFEEKEMLKYGRWGAGNFPMKRERPEKGKAVNLRFFPEGGSMVQGVTSRVAFEVTDELGNPIEVTGTVLDADKQELCQITTLHEGRSVFTYTPPGAGKRKDIAIVEYNRKKYQFDLPTGLPQGVVMEIDNLSYDDSIGVCLRKNGDTPEEMLGLVVFHGGRLQKTCVVYMEEDEVNFKISKTGLPLGVSQIVLFNGEGAVLCDRLIFTGKKEWLDIHVQTDKPAYKPFELVGMEISVTDSEMNPASSTFSLSIRDSENEVECHHNILTDLLLMSEIKGYIRNPAYYFEEKNDIVETQRAMSLLDLLLMVQGWRRYSWKQMAGVEPFELKYRPEQGIETHGNVVTLVKQKPRPNADVSLLLLKKEADDVRQAGFTEFLDLDNLVRFPFIETFVTDSMGRFAFVSDVEGKWNMILSVSEKGKKKDHRIMLDRVFSPEPQRYRYTDLQVEIAEKNIENDIFDDETDEKLDENLQSLMTAYRDSLSKLGINEKIISLEEVTVKAKKKTKEQEIYRNRSTSVAYYDVASEYDDIYDMGGFVGNDIHELLKNMNPNFRIEWSRDREWILYNNKYVLFVINYQRVDLSSFIDMIKYQLINIQSIKSIYINETMTAFCQNCFHPRGGCSELFDRFGCVVFIETYPEGQIPVEGAKGVRKTWLEGYSQVKEFYSPDYSVLPPEADYRRTLYWNPSVTPDETGHASIQFYNNSRCKHFKISAETVTSQGIIGIYKHD